MRHKSLLIILFLYVLSSCNNNNRIKEEAKKLIGRDVVFPSHGVLYSCGSNMSIDSILHAKIKIVTYFDDLPCTSCGIKMLRIWEKEIFRIDSEILYVPVVHSKRNIKKMLDSLNYSSPIVYDSLGEFGKDNCLEDISTSNRTFLIGSENNILLIGEPFKNDKLKALYKKQINKMKIDYAAK